MASSIQELKISGFANYLPAVFEGSIERYEEIFRENEHRVYSLAFWMTDNEIAAEELMANTFRRAFAATADPSAEKIDRAFINELRDLMPIGVLTLDCAPATEVLNVRSNVLRVHLERAVVQLPATERLAFLLHDVEGYDHDRVARTLGISEEDSRNGLHQARLRMRELLASM
jgi:RNA polymerase sigma-70 factor (ECF subfamily)